MKREFSRFVGVDLGGARGKTTAVAELSLGPDGEPLVQDVAPRHRGVEPWRDPALVDFLADRINGGVVAFNAPLTIPACLRCTLAECPGQLQCEDPAVEWLREVGAELRDAAVASDRDRIAAVPSSGGFAGNGRSAPTKKRGLRLAPYVHRNSELVLHYERGLLPRDVLGLATGRIAARASHLRRLLAARGFRLNENLIEVSPRATVKALFGGREARGYKRDADPWETRASILERLGDLRFAPSSRLSHEEVLRNDHCFEALLSGYTAYLWARDGWQMPADDADMFHADGWIWAPPES